MYNFPGCKVLLCPRIRYLILSYQNIGKQVIEAIFKHKKKPNTNPIFRKKFSREVILNIGITGSMCKKW